MASEREPFEAVARSAQVTVPQGVSRREGWTLVALAGMTFVAMAIAFQAHNMPWGGIVLFGSLIAYMAGIVGATVRAHRARRVHPFGFDRAFKIAGLWEILLVGVCGWWWIAQGPHGTSAVLTTLAALAATAPLALVGLRLVRAGR
jgi:fatty-acid desaturase